MDFKDVLLNYWPRWNAFQGLAFGLFCLVLFLAVERLCRKRHASLYRGACLWLAVSYTLVVLASTVFTRFPQTSRRIMWMPFWSYFWGFSVYGTSLVEEVILNVLLLMPLGMTGPAIFKPFSRHPVRSSVLLGFCVSVSIEILQLLLKRGLFEFDDILHNTLGAALGACMGWGILKLAKKVRLKPFQIQIKKRN